MRTELKPVEALFLAAVDITNPAERAKLLDEQCGNDSELRRRVEALLLAHDRADSLLDQPIVAGTSSLNGEKCGHAPENPEETSEFSSVEPDTSRELIGFLSPTERPDSLGRLGHYEVLEVLGRGGFGIVLRAFDETLQRVVAVKVLAPALSTTSPARKRFLREARSSAAVRHENVVRVHAVEEKPLPHLVMEFVPGETLQQRLDRTGPLDVAEMLSIGRQIALGLAAAHETGVIHRDIKPGNILIESGPNDSGPGLKVKISDFGLARAADDASLTQSGVVAGTPMYMAPEQAKGEALDHRADLFSLGSVLYVICTGRPPFRAPGTMAVLKRVCEDQPRPVREIIPEIPHALAQIIERLHQKDPAERFQSAREVAETLQRCEAKLKTGGDLRHEPGILLRRPRKAVRGRYRKGFLVAAGALILLLVAYLLTPRFGTEPARGESFRTAPAIPVDLPNTTRLLPDPTEKLTEPWPALFNGKDLTGWKAYPQETQKDWRVENGVLIGRGKKSYLYYEPKEFEDFHLRADFRISEHGNGGVYFRSPLPKPGPNPGDWPDAQGYEAQIIGPQAAASHYETGSLINFTQTRGIRINADSWHRIEVIADGPTMTVRINGIITARAKDDERKFARGHIALQLFGPDTEVGFRNLEINELGNPSLGQRAVQAEPPAGEFIRSLKTVVAAKQKILEHAKALRDAGQASPQTLMGAEIEVIEAEIVLARAEKKADQILDLLQKLVIVREKELALITIRFEAGMEGPASTARSKSDLAEAISRLTKAKSEKAQQTLTKP